MSILDKIKINKGAKLPAYPFTYMFKGFENVAAVKRLFGKDTRGVLSKLKVELFESAWGGYLWINNKNKAIVCNLHYIKTGDKRHVYLDVIHELVHIKQSMNGQNLFDENYEYVDAPTEIEAYRIAAEEAKRIGMTKKEIIDYLKVDWVKEKGFRRLLKAAGL